MSDYKQKYLKYKKKYLDLKEQSGGDFYTDLIKFDGRGKNYNYEPVFYIHFIDKEIISITIGIKKYMSQPKFYITVKKWNTDNAIKKLGNVDLMSQLLTFSEETKTYDISIQDNKVCKFENDNLIVNTNNEKLPLSFSLKKMIISKDRNDSLMTFEENKNKTGFIWNIDNMTSNLLDEKINDLTVREIMNNSKNDLKNFYEKFPTS